MNEKSKKESGKTAAKTLEENNYKNMGVGRWLLLVIQGALVGVGAILPGISGGVLMVLFGIYRPVMELLSHPIRALKKYIRMFIPFIIGCVVGFILLAKLLAVFFERYEIYAICLFAGLIAGTIPMLWKSAGEQGRTKGGYTAMVLSFVILLAMLLVFKHFETTKTISITPNIWWYLFCGIVWGASMIVPGLSSSSILLAMGLYKPMMNGVGMIMDDFGASMGVIIPLFAGIALTAFGCAKLVNRLFEKRYPIASHAVLGFVLASTVMIIPTQYSGVLQIVICVLCAGVGFAVAWFMDYMSDKFQKEGRKD